MGEKLVQIVVQADTSTELNDKFAALFPTWPTLLATILALIILLTLLTILVYKPIKRLVQNRKNYIQNNIDEAEKANQSALVDREQANEELINARVKAAEILVIAKTQAEDVRTEKITRAKEEADRLLIDAQKNIEAQQAKFEIDSRNAIIEVALSAAAQIIEKEVDNSTNRQIIENFIEANK